MPFTNVGGDVLLFRERELYCMTDPVNRYTRESVRFVLGLSLLVRVWEYRYTKLAGSFLAALSRLLARNVRIYADNSQSRMSAIRFRRRPENKSFNYCVARLLSKGAQSSDR